MDSNVMMDEFLEKDMTLGHANYMLIMQNFYLFMNRMMEDTGMNEEQVYKMVRELMIPNQPHVVIGDGKEYTYDFDYDGVHQGGRIPEKE